MFLLLVVAACSGTEPSPQDATAVLIPRQMNHQTDTRGKPPIDTDAPAAFETATFALG